MSRTHLALSVLAAVGLSFPAVAGQVTVGSGASVDLATGGLDLGCTDLTVAGSLSAGSVGFAAARDVTIDPAGLVDGQSATLEVAGDWSNAGTFDGGSSTVRLVDGCGLLSAVVDGDTTFASLEMTTASGKLYRFVSGSTQTVTGSLDLMGGPGGNQLGIRSTLAGVEAFLDFQGGIQTAVHVDVEDNHAIGTPIELVDSTKGSNTPGWILLAAIPTVSLVGLLGLAAMLVASGRRLLRGGRIAR